MVKQLEKLLSEYHIDADDRLIFVDDTWYEFARANQAPHLTDEFVLHKPLWAFIVGKEVQHLYRLMLDKARISGESIQISYRCDAPHVRRFLRMTMTPVTDGSVQFHNWLVRQEMRETVPLLDVLPERSEEILIICSWCKQVKLAEDEWVEVEEAVTRLGLFAAAPLPQLSHGMCPSCGQTWLG